MLLELDHVRIAYPTWRGPVEAVRGVDLGLSAGECLGLVGESGSGKSTLCRSLLRLLPRTAEVSGRMLLDGRDILAMGADELRALRGNRISLVPQGAMSALNPTITVGAQVVEAVRAHAPVLARRARERAVELFEATGLEERDLGRYQHELSGGMRQRVVIAMALAGSPDVLVADEPTTGLDVVLQGQVLRLLKHLQRELGLAMVLASHDLRVVLRACDRVAVMYGGKAVEVGPATTMATTPRHPYTRALLAAMPELTGSAAPRRWSAIPGRSPDPLHPPPGCPFHPRCPHAREDCAEREPPPSTIGDTTVACLLYRTGQPAPVLGGHGDRGPATAMPADRRRSSTEVVIGTAELTKVFTPRQGPLRRRARATALHDVTLTIHRGEAAGVVGESGSGKTTLARLLLRLLVPTGGQVVVGGRDLASLARDELRRYRRNIAMITQDPYDALHPGMRVEQIVAEPLDIAGMRARRGRARVADALERVGLEPAVELLGRYPAQLSGGQQQRVALARALVGEPEVLVADEPTSMLDASVRGSILDVLRELKCRAGLTMLVITHDLVEAAYLCDSIYVLRAGEVVEHGPARELLGCPSHPHTRALVTASSDPLAMGTR
ncbi:MAG: dipeptide ABC transporter ATP-binding protein [Acidimicrobiales bacterium]